MRNLFIRLYLVLLIAFIGLGLSIDAYVDRQSPSQDITSDIELHKSTFFLLNKELTRIKPSERQAYLDILQPSFGYPVSIKAIDELVFDQQQLDHLIHGGIVSRYADNLGKVWFFQQLSNSDNVIMLGPILIETQSSNNLFINLLFFFGLALIVFIWAWPISNGLKQLTKAAHSFGDGDFSVRASNDTPAPLTTLVQQFNAMAQRIQRLIKSHQELSHAVSHELRTPIARIRFAMEMVRELEDKQAQDKYLDTMDQNIEELDGLVDELLTYARFDREEPNLNIHQQDLMPLIYGVISKFQLTHQALTIHCLQPENVQLLARFDFDAIERSLDNLVRNACRYAAKEICISVIQNDTDTQLMVDDDGNGVPEANRQQLFEPFVRLDQSRDRNSGGIGLGLAMVKRLVELHHGSAEVCDAPQGGARFILTWPNS